MTLYTILKSKAEVQSSTNKDLFIDRDLSEVLMEEPSCVGMQVSDGNDHATSLLLAKIIIKKLPFGNIHDVKRLMYKPGRPELCLEFLLY